MQHPKQPCWPSHISSEQQHHQSVDRQRSVEKKGVPTAAVSDQKLEGINFPAKEVKGLVKYGKHAAGEEGMLSS